MRFEISYTSENDPSDRYMDVDVEIIVSVFLGVFIFITLLHSLKEQNYIQYIIKI